MWPEAMWPSGMWAAEMWPKDPGSAVTPEAGFACPEVKASFSGRVSAVATFSACEQVIPAISGRASLRRR